MLEKPREEDFDLAAEVPATGVCTLILLRHGQSIWNVEEDERFTGWWDVPLTVVGEREAAAAGRPLRDSGLSVDALFTSLLSRTTRTADIATAACAAPGMETKRSWRLNERHYGALQGRNKRRAAEEDGEALVAEWRRSWDVAPPPMTPGHPHWAGIYDDDRYRGIGDALPVGESLEACARRLEPFWTSDVAPAVRSGLTTLVVGHANSLRALLRIIFRRSVTEQEIRDLKLPTGVPLIYHLEERPCGAQDDDEFCALGLGAEPKWELVPRPPPPGCSPQGKFLIPLSDECPVAYEAEVPS